MVIFHTDCYSDVFPRSTVETFIQDNEGQQQGSNRGLTRKLVFSFLFNDNSASSFGKDTIWWFPQKTSPFEKLLL